MADRSIGALPQAPNLDDDSLMVVEQQGTAMKITGAQFKEFGKLGVMQAGVETALRHPEIGESFRAYLKELAATL